MASQVGWGYRTTGLEGSPEGSRDGLGVMNSARPRPGPEPGLRQNPEEAKNRSEQKPGVEPALVPEPELAWARTTDQSQLLVSRRIWKKFLFRSRCGKPSPDGSGTKIEGRAHGILGAHMGQGHRDGNHTCIHNSQLPLYSQSHLNPLPRFVQLDVVLCLLHQALH